MWTAFRTPHYYIRKRGKKQVIFSRLRGGKVCGCRVENSGITFLFLEGKGRKRGKTRDAHGRFPPKEGVVHQKFHNVDKDTNRL